MPPTALLPREQKVLAALCDLHYATNRQLMRHSYAETSYEYVCRITRSLVGKGMLAEDFERRKTQRGSSKSIFFLTGKAHRELAPDLPKMQPVMEGQQEHLLGVNNLLLTTMDYCRRYKNELTDFRHDLVTKKKPVEVIVDGKARKYVPDLFVTITRDEKPWHICFELDQGSEDEELWRKKVRYLLSFARTGARDYFGVDRLTLAIVVNTTGRYYRQSRIANLYEWTKEELQSQGAPAWGQNFLITRCDPETVDPGQLFTANRFLPVVEEPRMQALVF